MIKVTKTMKLLKYWFGEEVGDGETKIHYTPTPPDANEDPPLEIENPNSNDVQTEFERSSNEVQTMFGRSSNEVTTIEKRSQTANASDKKKYLSMNKGDKAMAELSDYPEIMKKLLDKKTVREVSEGFDLETLEVTKNKGIVALCEQYDVPQAQAARLVLETRIYKEHRFGMRYFKLFWSLIAILLLGWWVSPKVSDSPSRTERANDTITDTRKFAELWAEKRGVVFTTTRLDLLEKELRGLSPTSGNERCLKQFKIQNEKWFQKDITE